VRLHFNNFLSDVTLENIEKAQLGLGHSFSRNKVMFDPNRQDKPVIQVIALIESFDKDINTFCMRLKEWYSWHFPELTRIVNDNYIIVGLVSFFETKENLLEANDKDHDELVDNLNKFVGDEDKCKEIIEAAKISMGIELNDLDIFNIKNFTIRIKRLISLRQRLLEYLTKRMYTIAPNLTSIVGELVGAKLISHSGSLTNLSK